MFVNIILKEDIIEQLGTICIPKDMVKFALRYGI